MWATSEVKERLFDYFQIEQAEGVAVQKDQQATLAIPGGIRATLELYDRLGIDGLFRIKAPYIGPPLRVDEEYWEDEWGIGHRRVKYATGIYNERTHFPLAELETIADLEAYRWPDPDWYDYDALQDLITQCGDRTVECGLEATFPYHNFLRGLETSLMDPFLRPEFTHHLVQRIADFFLEYSRRCFEVAAGYFDLTLVAGDYGQQTGLLLRPDTFAGFYRDLMQRAIDLAQSYDLIVFHHDDGDIRQLLPTWASLGMDVLNPIQWRCGNWDLATLKAEYGEQFCFHGGVDNQQTLPFGTPQDVRDEVKWLIENLASDGTGFIVAPCHNLQSNTPVENILALYEAAHEYGTF